MFEFEVCARRAKAQSAAIGAGVLFRVTIVGILATIVSCQESVQAPEPNPPLTIVGMDPASGPLAGGTVVTLLGTNFNNVISVTVAGLELQDRVVRSATEITGTTPPSTNAGRRDVVVISSSNGTNRCTGCFTYLNVPPPPPTINEVTPAMGPVSGGTAITITGTHFHDVTQVIVGREELLLSGVSSTRITGRTPPSAFPGPADVVITSGSNRGRCNGCFTYQQEGDTISIALMPGAISVGPGEQASSVLRLSPRSGFDGPVGFVTAGAPNGVTVQFRDGTGITGMFLVSVRVEPGVPPGRYPIDVRARITATTELRTTMDLTVLASNAGGNTAVRFCNGYPFLVAYQDGDGPWTRATGPGYYSFNINSGRGALAWVTGYINGGVNLYAVFDTHVYYGTQAELSQLFPTCEPPPAPPTATIAFEVRNAPAYVWVGVGDYTTQAASNVFLQVPGGTADLVAAYQSGASWSGFNGKAIIRRNLNLMPGTTVLPAVDFNSTEAFPLVTRNLQVTGGTAWSVRSEFVTANGTAVQLFCDDPYNYGGCNPATTFLSVPAPQLGDVHRLEVITDNQRVLTCFREATDLQLALPPAPHTPTLSTVAITPSVRYRFQYSRPAEYNGGIQASFASRQPTGINPSRSVELNASAAYLGASMIDLTIPDFSTLIGWNPDWGLTSPASFRMELRGWIETALPGPRCGGSEDPFGTRQRPQAWQQHAAWYHQTVVPAGVPGSSRE